MDLVRIIFGSNAKIPQSRDMDVGGDALLIFDWKHPVEKYI